MTRFLVLAVAGLVGMVGISAAAGSSHAGASPMLTSAALVCLANAPALVALALGEVRSKLLTLAAGLLAIGTLVFVADMGAREFAGGRLLPLAAPIGGTLMIGGWFCIMAGGLARVWHACTRLQ